MQQQVSYRSYSKHRKPFLNTHYPFLTPNQINAKLRQEWAALNFTKITKNKSKLIDSHNNNCSSHIKSPSKRLTSNQNQTSVSSLALQRSFHDPTPDPPLTPLPWDQMFDNDDEDIGSPYQRNKSRIDELNRSAFNNATQRCRQPHKLQSKSATITRVESEIDEEYTFLDKGDYNSNSNNFTRRKDYCGNVLKLDYPAPVIGFGGEGNTDNGEARSSILKNYSSTSLNELNSDAVKSKVRFSHLTPVTHQPSKNKFLANSNRSPRFSMKAKDGNFDKGETLYPIQKKTTTSNRTIASDSNSNFEFDDDADSTYTFCSYSTFKKNSNPCTSSTEINSNNKEKISTLAKSKSTSLLQNTISACSKMIKKSRSLRGRSSSKRKSVIKNKAETFSPPLHNGKNPVNESKSWQNSPVKSRQLSNSLNAISSSKFDLESEDDASLYHDDENFGLAYSNYYNMETDSHLRKSALSSQSKRRSCTKETSPKRLTPSTIARQLRSMSKQLSATKLFSPKTKIKESCEKSKPSPSIKKGRPFSKSQSDSNMRDLIGYNDGKVKQRKNTAMQSRMNRQSSSPANVTRQLRSASKQLSESWNSSETLRTPFYGKKVSFCTDHTHSQMEDDLSYCNIDQNTGLVFNPNQEIKHTAQRRRSNNITPLYKTDKSETKNLSSASINEVSDHYTTTTPSLRSFSRQIISTTKTVNPTLTKSSDWYRVLNELSPIRKEVSFLNDYSDTEDRESFYSDDENAALIVRQDENFNGNIKDNDNLNEDATDYKYKAKGYNSNNRRDAKVKFHTSDLHDQSTVNKYIERRCQTVSNGDDEFLCNTQNDDRNRHYNDGDEENHLVRKHKQTKSAPTPTPRKSKKKLKQAKMKVVEKSNSSFMNSEISNSRSVSNTNKSFQWEDDNDEQDSFLGVNHQWDEYANVHQDYAQKHTMNKIQHSERNESNRSKNQFQENVQSDDVQSNKKTCQNIELEKYSNSNNESFYNDDSDNRNDNENILVGHYDDDEDEEEDDDDNAFFTSKMACQTHAVLNGALRRIQLMQSEASDFCPTICSITDDMVSSYSDIDLEDEDDFNINNNVDNEVTRPSYSYNRSLQQRQVGDFTLTDLFDDPPNNRPRVDPLGMTRRMFHSSTVETCSNFGNLFDEDDIFF